ncbi:unnamed protein product [Ectocarpus sp. 8 AP-2014]
MMSHGWMARLGMVALVLSIASRFASAEIVEAANVTNVAVDATAWDLRLGSEGGCGLTGCDPRLTRDGEDNSVAESRWSCTLGTATTCELQFEFDDYFDVSYLMIYFHESDDATQLSISFDVEVGYDTVHTDLTSPGTALGAGQRVNMLPDTSGNYLHLLFDLTSDQTIDVSEVEIYLDVDDPDDVVVAALPTISTVKVDSVSNVVAAATFWDLRTDAGCGEAGCDPLLAHDGHDNTVASSRWSCESSLDVDVEDYVFFSSPQYCHLQFVFGDEGDSFWDDDNLVFTVSHVVIYVHESDDATKEAMTMNVYSSYSGNDPAGSFVTVPGTPLGTGHRVNLNRPLATSVTVVPVLSAGQWVDISEVEIYVEVTQTEVFIPAAEAWNDVAADTITTVTPSASWSVAGFGPNMTTDGDDNTVAASYWSCQAPTGTLSSSFGYESSFDYDSCWLYFELNDEYTASYMMLYVHESNDATKEPIQFDVYGCTIDAFSCYNEYASELVGSSTTVPGTPLGEGERVNLIRPSAVSLGIHFNLSAGAIVSISEVELFVQTPDATPTPAPFVPTPETEAPVYSWMSGDDSDDDYVWANDDDDAAGVIVSSDDDYLVDDSSSSTASDRGGVVSSDDDSSSSTANDEAGGVTSGDDGPAIGLPSSTADDADDADDAADIEDFGNGALARGGVCSRQGLVGAVAVGAILISFAANAMY